jgi:hypothetical protein
MSYARQSLLLAVLAMGIAWFLGASLGQATASDFSDRDMRRREVVALEKIAASLQKLERCAK